MSRSFIPQPPVDNTALINSIVNPVNANVDAQAVATRTKVNDDTTAIDTELANISTVNGDISTEVQAVNVHTTNELVAKLAPVAKASDLDTGNLPMQAFVGSNSIYRFANYADGSLSAQHQQIGSGNAAGIDALDNYDGNTMGSTTAHSVAGWSTIADVVGSGVFCGAVSPANESSTTNLDVRFKITIDGDEHLTDLIDLGTITGNRAYLGYVEFTGLDSFMGTARALGNGLGVAFKQSLKVEVYTDIVPYNASYYRRAIALYALNELGVTIK